MGDDDAHPATPPHAFFLSHPNEDRARAIALRDALAACGVSAFLDTSSIPHGVLWAAALDRALATCRCFVVLLTPHAALSPYVEHEIVVAVERARTSPELRIVPVWLASVQPPKRTWPAPLSIYQGPCWPATETAAAFAARTLIAGADGQTHQISPPLGTHDEVLAAAWAVARTALRNAVGAGSAFALVGELLAAAGLHDAARHATPPTWRGRLGDDPERWAIVVPRGRADVRATQALGSQLAHEVLAIADLDDVTVDTPAVVLHVDPDGFGLCDLLAAAASTFWAFTGLAIALAHRGVTEQRLLAAAADRTLTRGTFVEQAWRHASGARRYAQLRALTARTRATFARIDEYRGVEVTLPRRQVDDCLERLIAGELRSAGPGAPIVALVGAQGIGKTSALCSFIERHPDVPAIFVQARRIDAHFRDRRWRLDDEVDVAALVREIDRYRSERPHLLLCVDGLNEGDPGEVARALDSPATEALLGAGVALAVSCWPASWKERFRRLCSDPVEVALDEFSDDELAQALARRGHTRDAVLPSLWPLARRPALLDHVLRLSHRLGRAGPVSRMDVFWADLQFKAERRWIDAPGDGTALKSHLVALIQNFQASTREAPARAGARAAELARWPGGSPWQDAHHKLLTLQDFDVIRVDREGRISLADETIAIAVMGLLLCEEMHLLRDDLRAKLERGRKFLDEIADLVEPSEATLQALGFSLGHDDAGRTLALLVLLLDNRNFDTERLNQFGHRLVAGALIITRHEVADDLLENSTICRTRAEDLVVEHADTSDLPWITALLASDRPDDANLVHGLVDVHGWPALIEPLCRALAARRERGGRVDDVGFELLSALVNGYDVALVDRLVRDLDAARSSRRKPPAALLQLAEALRAPALLEPLLALAERHPASAGRILRALPALRADRLEARLRRWLARDPRTAVGIFEWAVAVGSPLALRAARAEGSQALTYASGDDIVELVLGATRCGWSRQLATWALRTRTPDEALARAKLALVLAYVAVAGEVPDDPAAACLRRATRLGLELDGDFTGGFHDLPLDPDRRLRATAHLRDVVGAEADDWLRAAVCPDRVSSQLADELRGTTSPTTAARLLDEHVHWLLPGTGLRPDDVRATVARASGAAQVRLAQSALRFLCLYGFPGTIAMSECVGATALEPGVLSLMPLAGEVADHVAACLRHPRPSLHAVATVLAIWGRTRGPLPADVDRWVGKSLGGLDDDGLATVVDLARETDHDGLGGAVRRLCRDGAISIDRQWGLCASGVTVDRALVEQLLESATGPAKLVALNRLSRRRMPGAERWLAARLQAVLDSPGPHARDLTTTTRLAELLPALVLHDVPATDAALDVLIDRHDPDNHGIGRGLLTWVARWRPERLPPLLGRHGKRRNSSALEHAVGWALSVMPPDARIPVFTALCFDRDPSETAPRPDLDGDDERFHAFVGVARHPPTSAELALAATAIDRRWRGNLAHLAVFADDDGAWLAQMAAHEPSGVARTAARHAQLRRAQRTQLSAMLRRLAADPQGTLRSPLALHLALRLDGTHQPALDALAQGPFEVRRALAWILRAARHRPTDWILTP